MNFYNFFINFGFVKEFPTCSHWTDLPASQVVGAVPRLYIQKKKKNQEPGPTEQEA